MADRKLITGEAAPELAQAVTLTVYTKCPEKYKLVDLETGEEYRGVSTVGKHSWKKIGKQNGIQ